MPEFPKKVVGTFLDRFKTPLRLVGTPADFCSVMLEDLWSGDFYYGGLHHFKYFWIRDFGTIAKSLVRLGHHERVKRNAQWALASYMKAGKIATCISINGKVFDIPLVSVDALPWMVYLLKITDTKLTDEQRDFLARQLERYSKYFIDPASGEIREGMDYCEVRDAARYSQSAYTVTMLHVLKRDGEALGLPVAKYLPLDYQALLLEKYWNGNYFNADRGNTAFSAECNLLPLWLDVGGVEHAQGVIDEIERRGLADPYPMHYTDQHKSFSYRWWAKIIMPNYAGTTIWTWHGALYLHALKNASSPFFEKRKDSFESLLTRYQTFPELLNPDGSWYKSLFYQSERGMSWAAIYLDAVQKA